MPIAHRIDRVRKLVIATATGTFTKEEMFAYQRDVWSRPDVAGFDELIDVSEARFDRPAPDQISQLTRLAASMESSPSKLAIVAPGDLAFGLGRMYQALRTSTANNKKDVGVFRTHAEAWAFLGKSI